MKTWKKTSRIEYGLFLKIGNNFYLKIESKEP